MSAVITRVGTPEVELLESMEQRGDGAFYAGVAVGVLLVIACSS